MINDNITVIKVIVKTSLKARKIIKVFEQKITHYNSCVLGDPNEFNPDLVKNVEIREFSKYFSTSWQHYKT